MRRFKGFRVAGCKKRVQEGFKTFTENRKVGLNTLKLTFVKKIIIIIVLSNN